MRRGVLFVVLACGCGRVAFDHEPPDAASDASEPSCIVDVSAGRDHTCAVRSDGTVWCWGANEDEQLGRAGADSATPQQVSGLAGAVDVEAGAKLTCARTPTAVYCWGNDQAGQLGDGVGISSTATPQLVMTSNTFDRLSIGRAHVCARTTPSNTIYCWGYNGWGQIGVGDLTDRFVPTSVNFDGLAVSASLNEHTCAIHTSTDVMCWGHDGAGKLGNGAPGDSLDPALTGLTQATLIATAADASCAVLMNGETWCWGVNTVHQLCNGMTAPSQTPTLSCASGLVALELGGAHGCGINGDGQLMCWGRNDNGQTAAVESPTTTAQVVALEGTLQVELGAQHSCARTGNGLYCWGANDRGQLGSEGASDKPTPTRVAVPCP